MGVVNYSNGQKSPFNMLSQVQLNVAGQSVLLGGVMVLRGNQAEGLHLLQSAMQIARSYNNREPTP